MLSKQTRKQMEETIYKTFALLDTTGENTKKYKSIFSTMSDAQFDSFFKQFFKNEDEYLTLDIVTYEREPSMDDVEKAAKYLGVPLYERIAFPHMSSDPSEPFVTPFEVPVGHIHVKRLKVGVMSLLIAGISLYIKLCNDNQQPRLLYEVRFNDYHVHYKHSGNGELHIS